MPGFEYQRDIRDHTSVRASLPAVSLQALGCRRWILLQRPLERPFEVNPGAPPVRWRHWAALTPEIGEIAGPASRREINNKERRASCGSYTGLTLRQWAA